MFPLSTGYSLNSGRPVQRLSSIEAPQVSPLEEMCQLICVGAFPSEGAIQASHKRSSRDVFGQRSILL